MYKGTPLVTILINNYNYGQFLADAIDSALNQTYSQIEVIVVDDGSSDNSKEVICSYGDQIQSVLKANGGQASAFNAGFAVSQGDIICFLDADDVFLPEKVEKIVITLQKESEVKWCFHDVQLVQADAKTKIEGSPVNPSFKCDLRKYIRQGKIQNTSSSFIIPPTSGLCLKRELLEKILPMPESIKITSDSYLQFGAFALSKGFVLGEALVLQRIHGNNLYTFRLDRKNQLKAEVCIRTAYWLRHNFPSLVNLTDNLIANGLSLSWQTEKIDPECQQLLKKYHNSRYLVNQYKIKLRAIYYYLKDRKQNKIINSLVNRVKKTV